MGGGLLPRLYSVMCFSADGFRKVPAREGGSKGDAEFSHECFVRGKVDLLDNIKRKVTCHIICNIEPLTLHSHLLEFYLRMEIPF